VHPLLDDMPAPGRSPSPFGRGQVEGNSLHVEPCWQDGGKRTVIT
jgi:hypothetical protein